jgi:hypothetical protein
MIQTVNAFAFRDAFSDFGRNDNFSYEGQRALFAYLEELEEDTGTPYELDVIALCCEFTEYTIETFFNDYEVPGLDEPNAGDEERLEAVRNYLDDNTMIVRCDENCILFACF